MTTRLHCLVLAAAALLLAGPAQGEQPEVGQEQAPAPATLAPYIHDGRFDPGDYGWMRGAFADASPTQKAEWEAFMAWRNTCREAQFSHMRAELKARGVTAKALEHRNGTGLCGVFAYALASGDRQSWPLFQAALTRGRPVAQAIVWSAALAQVAADAGRADTDMPAGYAKLLTARPVTDQLLRAALSWGDTKVTAAPALDQQARDAAHGLIWLAIAERDHANTAWLKAQVAAHGWPTIATVGKKASHRAWLLVQHADDDPVFQLDMLRLMEPLAERGAIAKADYAYLYDRVMLGVAGQQRYGTQLTCANGRFVPQPLEAPEAVDARARCDGFGHGGGLCRTGRAERRALRGRSGSHLQPKTLDARP